MTLLQNVKKLNLPNLVGVRTQELQRTRSMFAIDGVGIRYTYQVSGYSASLSNICTVISVITIHISTRIIVMLSTGIPTYKHNLMLLSLQNNIIRSRYFHLVTCESYDTLR
uniref:Uncharacterized protein n=1 Tax=Cacopsylla melanoneura TaxID=428564 RepID=A0A8D8W2R0_9HEMI